MSTPAPEITVFTKSGGPLTKHIRIAEDGSIVSDGSACTMQHGRARRVKVNGIADLAALVERLDSNQALALGALRADLPEDVEIVTKHKLNGHPRPDVIARTGDDILYRKGRPAFALLDYDTKGMPPDIAARIAALGGFGKALATVMPDLSTTARMIRRSTSAGLMRTDTGAQLPGSNGLHGYVAVGDGANIERFLKTLHARCWLHGLGWLMVGVAGQLLDRSIVDRRVGASERLVFEGPPKLKPPLAQDPASRRPIMVKGGVLDTIAACPPLTLVERERLRKLQAEASQRLLPERNAAREAFVAHQTKRMIERTGLSQEAAARVIERQCAGILLPNIELAFTDPELQGLTVADVLADPARFDGAALADPIEGVEYGRSTAKIMRRADGTPWIHSFAHGRTVYELKFDLAAARAIIEKAPNPAAAFVKLALTADLDEIELDQLLHEVAGRAGVGVRVLAAKLKAARQQRDKRQRQEDRERRLAERNDPRPSIPAPAMDAPWLPQAATIHEVVMEADGPRRPRQDIDDGFALKRKYSVPDTHAFTSQQEE